jgi:hypothetical protein
MENQKSHEEMFRIRNKYNAKYGMEIDEWSAVILCELEDNFKGLNKSLNGSTKEIEQAATFIKGQVKPIYFSTEEQAYKYGLSSRFYPFLASIIGILLMWIAYCIFGLQKEEKANLKLFNNLISNGLLISDHGELKLILKAKGNKDNVFGTYFEYDSKKDRLMVPLKPDQTD